MTKSDPFYKKVTTVLFGLVLFVYILSTLADILIPLAFSILIAILLNPLCNRFLGLGLPRVLSILLTLLITFVLLGGLFYFLSFQIIQFGEMMPQLKDRLVQLLSDLQQYVKHTFGVSIQRQTQYLKEAATGNKALVGQTISSALGIFGLLFLMPVYVFLLLFYKTLILDFFFEVFARKDSQSVAEIIQETKSAIQSYVVGLLIETSIVAVLNVTALVILGVPYGILLGVIGAFLNMIPYIGGAIAVLLPVLMAMVTKDGFTTQLGIIGAYVLIQFIDNNILVPRVVSSKVQINALVSIIVVLLGGALWGVAGMFLAILFVAFLKIIFDRIDALKPLGRLLGDQAPLRPKQGIKKVLGK
ncbi:AI-2E family transporter [Pontibacter burrus]|uniref:AI-2E family transporter n=1 Tax=Pontibacter burrus TaxID=2704466 RepID=A0A6B3LRJ4_9BACT|nr:AI-2E family transporter [Pontibacter burrus]NEM99449.1 AI-2E family transporter [Pontibacter burrus]